jgi:hypothetical protein
MRIEQRVWTREKGWTLRDGQRIGEKPHLVILFAETGILKGRGFLEEAKAMYPGAHLLGCSTSGEICGTGVFDGTVAATAVRFGKTEIMGARLALSGTANSFEAGRTLARSIEKSGLRHVFVLSDGLGVNGSDLVKGLESDLAEGVTITGGLAGNGDRFEETYVFWDDLPSRNSLAILGFYGDSVRVGYGSMGGWDPFGPERVITRSKENLLYELDGQSALDIYKKYLGDHAGGLPAAGLRFPLSIRTKNGDAGIVRTILAVNEKEKSMTFAGAGPAGASAG